MCSGRGGEKAQPCRAMSPHHTHTHTHTHTHRPCSSPAALGASFGCTVSSGSSQSQGAGWPSGQDTAAGRCEAKRGAGDEGAVEKESPEDAEGWRRDAGGSHLRARPRLKRNRCGMVTGSHTGNPVGEGARALCLQAWDHCLTRHPAKGGAELGRHHGIGRLEGQGRERLQHLCTLQASCGV